MVVEVIVNDPDLKDIDDAIGEPDVTINGKIFEWFKQLMEVGMHTLHILMEQKLQIK